MQKNTQVSQANVTSWTRPASQHGNVREQNLRRRSRRTLNTTTGQHPEEATNGSKQRRRVVQQQQQHVDDDEVLCALFSMKITKHPTAIATTTPATNFIQEEKIKKQSEHIFSLRASFVSLLSFLFLPSKKSSFLSLFLLQQNSSMDGRLTLLPLRLPLPLSVVAVTLSCSSFLFLLILAPTGVVL